MKIVMLCEFYNEHLEFQENLLVRYYLKHGHQVVVLTSTFESVFDYYEDRHDNSAPARAYHCDGARIIRLRYRFNILNRVRAYTSIYKHLIEEAPDLIFVHDIIPNIVECVKYVRRQPSCRMIMDYHADYSNSAKNKISLIFLHGIIRKFILDFARPYISRIYPIVPAGVTFLSEVYKVPACEMEILPLGADIDRVRKLEASNIRSTKRAANGYDKNDIVVVTGGKLTGRKKTELLIDAIVSLDRPNLHLFIIGDASPSDISYLASLKRMTHNNPRIIFSGWLSPEDVYGHFLMADLAVFPASQSILWQQAIASGLPLVVGDTGHQDVSYLNLHENILILPADEINVVRLSEVIEDLIANQDKLVRMKLGALLVATEILDWNILIQKTLQFNSGSSQA
jgi:1,2-diacylglycerol 3-alpha-glucosyltransferase